MGNSAKRPSDWQTDIDQSVSEYDGWYLARAPAMFLQARGRAVAAVEEAMLATEDFRQFTPNALAHSPAVLTVARMCVSPPMARDRFVGFSGANKSLVTVMERDAVIPANARRLDMQLVVMCDFLRPLLDPTLFSWLEAKRSPTQVERERAMLVIGERLTATYYLPMLRNTQEVRQKDLMRTYLESEGFEESSLLPFEMPSGTFCFGRNVPVARADGVRQNLPVDCVVAPQREDLPLVCVEMKSAGDFTNVNKRRKEESDKHDALKRKYGDRVVFLLQLFGYFGTTYLSFEAAAKIDWAWDHRLSDLAAYLGTE